MNKTTEQLNTDDQLRALLAKMLPETVEDYGGGKLLWRKPTGTNGACIKSPYLDTELLHLASLVEAGLTVEADCDYLDALARIVDPKFGYRGELTLGIITATWQQRTRALAKVKGVAL